MKANVVTFVVGVLLTYTGCAQPGGGPTAPQLDSLRAEVEALEERSNDLALKGRIVSSQLFGSPLDNFFASPEFWENTYDSGQADCSRRCISTLTSERNACQDIADDTQRLRCFQEASDRASRCHADCARNNPTPIP